MFLQSSPLYSAFAQADFFGKCIFIFLFLLSALSWVILIYKIWLGKKERKISFAFAAQMQPHENNFLAFELPQGEPESPYKNIFFMLKQKTFELLKKNRFFTQDENQRETYLCQADISLLESQVYSTIAYEIKKMEKNLFILSTTVTLAPFLGLLGTVWGVLQSFAGLSSSQISAANASVLSSLSMALATTVLGLLIAIPALIAYNYLKNTIRDFTGEMENFSQKLISTLEIQYRRVDRE